MGRNRWTVLLALAVLAGLSAAGCGSSGDEPDQGADSAAGGSLNSRLPASIRKAGVLRVGTDATYPPFATQGPGGLAGLDVDLAKLLGKQLEVPVRFSNIPFTGLLTSVRSGRVDVAMNGITDKADRRKSVSFVDYLGEPAGGIIFTSENPNGITGPRSLCGKTVGVTKGSIFKESIEPLMKDCARAPRYVEFATDADSQTAVQSGRVAASVSSNINAAYLAKTAGHGKTFKSLEFPYPPGLQGAPLGAAIPKEARQLAEVLKAGFEAIVEDGSYRKALDRYGLGSVATASITFNGGDGL